MQTVTLPRNDDTPDAEYVEPDEFALTVLQTLASIGGPVTLTLRPGGDEDAWDSSPAKVRILDVIYFDGEWRLLTDYIEHDGTSWTPRIGVIEAVEFTTRASF